MATFKVNAEKLNLRSSPVKDFADKANVVGVLHKDALFESVGRLENELGGWHVGANGNCVSENWVGEFLPLSFLPEGKKVIYSEKNMSWPFSPIDGLNLTFFWNENILGQNVKIAILDSGINTSIDELMMAVEDKEHDLKSFVNNESVEDDYGHGTSCASIVSSQGLNLYGVSPKSKLIIGKIYSTKVAQTPEILLAALQWACEERQADIISMSFSIPFIKTPSNEIPLKYKAVADYIQHTSVSQNRLFIASIGNLGESANEFNAFPANCTGCISVGAYGQNKMVWSGSSWNTKISFVAPGVGIKGYDLTGQKSTLEPATSFACPFAAGIISNLLSFLKERHIAFTSTDFIDKLSFELPTDNNPLRFGKGILNPVESLKKLQI